MEQAITSRANERVKYAGRLATSAAFRAQEGLFLRLPGRFQTRTGAGWT